MPKRTLYLYLDRLVCAEWRWVAGILLTQGLLRPVLYVLPTLYCMREWGRR
jgi:hypothetical protein